MKLYSIKLGVTSLAIGLLTACGTPQYSKPPTTTINPIKVAESVERLELYFRPEGLSLSGKDQHAVGQFLSAYSQGGDGPVFINVPEQFSSSPGAMQTQSMIQQVMMQTGAAGVPVQTGYYQARSPQSPVVVSFRRLKTVAPDCRVLGNMAQTYSNQPYDSFGCAYSSNLAAMIQDPQQLLEPYTFGSSDSRRRMVVYDKYIAGEVTASEFPERQEVSAGNN